MSRKLDRWFFGFCVAAGLFLVLFCCVFTVIIFVHDNAVWGSLKMLVTAAAFGWATREMWKGYKGKFDDDSGADVASPTASSPTEYH